MSFAGDQFSVYVRQERSIEVFRLRPALRNTEHVFPTTKLPHYGVFREIIAHFVPGAEEECQTGIR